MQPCLSNKHRIVLLWLATILFFSNYSSTDFCSSKSLASEQSATNATASGIGQASNSSTINLNVLKQHDSLTASVQEKVVKLFGAGGARGLESYQTGILVGEQGHILTSWSTVLDVATVRVVTFDGRRLDATIVGVDPANEIALLQVTNAGLVGFDLNADHPIYAGQRVFAVSNLFGIATGSEFCSIQRGVVMAIAPLTQKRGRTKAIYQGKVLILDAMTNNPGAAGGALINIQGQLVGLLGKEVRDEQAGIWVNYALPVDVVKNSMDRILEGNTSTDDNFAKPVENPHSLATLGLTLIPDVLPKTPPYIDEVRGGSIASIAGLQANDLIIMLNQQRIDSRRTLEKNLAAINRADSFELLVQRGQELVKVQIKP